MMGQVTAFYAHEHGEAGLPIQTPDDVDALVDEVSRRSRSGWPVLIQAYIEGDKDTPEFCVGVDGDESVLTYSGRQWSSGIWHSVGDPSKEGHTLYYYMESDTEITDAARIPLAVARDAFKEFLSTEGARPELVSWHQYV